MIGTDGVRVGNAQSNSFAGEDRERQSTIGYWYGCFLAAAQKFESGVLDILAAKFDGNGTILGWR